MADTEQTTKAMEETTQPAEDTTATENAADTAVSLEKNTEPAAAEVMAADDAAETQASEEKTEEQETLSAEQPEEEEVVFAGPDMPLPPKVNTHANNAEISAAADDSDGVVFAKAVKNNTKSRIKVHKDRRALKGIVAALLVLCVAGGGGILAWQLNKNHQQDAQEVSAESRTSTEISTVSKSSQDAADTSTASEEPLDPSALDTSNILFGNNVTVEGVDLSGKSLTQAYDAMQDKLLEIREPISITVVCDGKSLTLTQNDFNFDTNIADVLVQAYHYSRGEVDNPTVENTFDGRTTDFKVQSTINTESVEEAIDKAAAFYDVLPVDAHVTSFNPNAAEKFTYADGADGFMLDHEELSSKIKGILGKGEKSGSFSIQTHQTPFKISMEDIKANTRLIASHSTIASNAYNSVCNMELALRAANGTVVMPGEKFSFNAMTGDTTNGNLHTYPNGVSGSYLPAAAYSQGKVVQEYGGGICQASTTLFLAAVKADMTITDRYAHMYPSVYASYGLDATVDYGNLDMSFVNNRDYPIYIATYVYDYNGDGMDELMAEIYGPLSEEYDEIVPTGWVTYAGNKGFSARGAKVYFKNGQEIRRENMPSGTYNYNYENYYYVSSLIPADIDYGSAAYPTWSTPTIYSPNGCGSNGPVAYGTAESVLANARKKIETPQTSQTSR